MVGSEEEINDELMGWIREAAEFSASKKQNVYNEKQVSQ